MTTPAGSWTSSAPAISNTSSATRNGRESRGVPIQTSHRTGPSTPGCTARMAEPGRSTKDRLVVRWTRHRRTQCPAPRHTHDAARTRKRPATWASARNLPVMAGGRSGARPDRGRSGVAIGATLGREPDAGVDYFGGRRNANPEKAPVSVHYVVRTVPLYACTGRRHGQPEVQLLAGAAAGRQIDIASSARAIAVLCSERLGGAVTREGRRNAQRRTSDQELRHA